MTKFGEALQFLKQHVDCTKHNCIIWPYSKDRNGYGQVGYNHKCRPAHRVVLELTKGPAPSKKHIARHSCNNKSCINPNHLHWGTHSDNIHDWWYGFKEKH